MMKQAEKITCPKSHGWSMTQLIYLCALSYTTSLPWTKRRKDWELINTSLALTYALWFICSCNLCVTAAQESHGCSETYQGPSYPSHRSWCPWTTPCLYTDTPCWQAAWRQLLRRCVPCFEAHRFDIAEPTAAPRSCNPLHPQPWCPAGRGWSLSPSLLSGRRCRHQLWPGNLLRQWLHGETVKIRENTSQGPHQTTKTSPWHFCASIQPQNISVAAVLYFTTYFPTYMSLELHINSLRWDYLYLLAEETGSMRSNDLPKMTEPVITKLGQESQLSGSY